MSLATLSIVGRETVGWTVPGDFEPWRWSPARSWAVHAAVPDAPRQTSWSISPHRALRRLNAALDRMAAGVLGPSFALLAWRAGVGGLESFQNGLPTMLLFP